ncbi:MAG: tetratricopeptide repeat protein [Flavobacteriales bacterium]
MERCYRSSFPFWIFCFSFLILTPFRGTGQERADSSIFQARHDSINEYLGVDLERAEGLARKNLELARDIGRKELLSTAYRDMGVVLKNSGSYRESLEYNERYLELSKELEDSTEIAEGYNILGSVMRRKADFDSALFYYEEALGVFKAIKDTQGIVSTYNNLGNIYRIRSELVRGLEYFQRALKLLDTSKTSDEDLGILYGNLGVVQKRREAYDKALKRYRQAQDIFRSIGDSGKVAATYLSIGQVLQNKGDSIAGLRRFRKAYSYFRKSGNRRREAITLLNIGGHHLQQGALDSALFYAQKGLEIGRELKALTIILSAQEKKAEVLHRNGDIQRALRIVLEGYEKASSLGSIKWQKAHSEIAYKAHRSLGNYKEALHFHREWSRLKDTLQNKERAEKLTRMEMRYQFEKEQMRDSLEHAKEMKVKNMKMKKKEAELARQKTVRNFLIGGGILLLFFALLLFERFRVARKRKKEVDRAYEELHEKNAELEDSINYASRIQSAILTSDAYFKDLFGEYFVFFNPKEVVSGDFYWAYGDARYTVWAAVDCTGHGVPGAFMSMIGNRLFNEVVVEHGERDPGTIFEKVRSGIIEALDQGNEEESNDGMDAALCVYDRKKGELSFAGAQNPLYIVQDLNEEPFEEGKRLEEKGFRLTEIKGDGSPLGRDPYKKEPFRTVTLNLKGGERLYTFSDGFPDQFGGSKGKKYRYKPFKKLLLSLQELDLSQQKTALEKEFQEWKGNEEQIDDVLVIGIKIPSG